MKEEPPGKGGEKRGPGVADSAKEQPPCAGLISVWALGGLDLVDSQQEAAIENCVVPSSPGEGPLRLEAASQGSVGAVRGLSEGFDPPGPTVARWPGPPESPCCCEALPRVGGVDRPAPV